MPFSFSFFFKQSKSAIAQLSIPSVVHAGRTSPKLSPGTLDTADDKLIRTTQLGCHNTGAEVSSGLFLNSVSQREEEALSPVSSVDLFTSPFSSKESILCEGWEQEPGLSVLQKLPPSGSVSPCSSVRSGAFTPSVMRIRYHTLAPASSLMEMPLTSCQTLGCDKHLTSPCPLSTRARHRPPPTQLSLLTAILRKGRLPVLSSALQRPYSPCWPISPVNMSSCMACSAASTVAPMVDLRAKSCAYKATTCTKPSCKARPKLPGLISETVSQKEIKGGISSRVKETSEAIDCNTHVSGSGIILTPEGRCSLPLSSFSPEPPSAHLYKQTHKSINPSMSSGSSFSRPMTFSPETYLDFPSQRNEHNSNDTSSSILKNTKPCQSSFSDLKLMQMVHEQFPTSDHKPSQESQETFASAATKYPNIKPDSLLRKNREIFQELEKIHAESSVFQHSPSPKVAGFSHLSNTLSISPRPGSCASTPECYTLSPSPTIHHYHPSPSPAYSLCSSPTSSLTGSTPDYIDRASKKVGNQKGTTQPSQPCCTPFFNQHEIRESFIL